jgi:hypothetical protein
MLKDLIKIELLKSHKCDSSKVDLSQYNNVNIILVEVEKNDINTTKGNNIYFYIVI